MIFIIFTHISKFSMSQLWTVVSYVVAMTDSDLHIPVLKNTQFKVINVIIVKCFKSCELQSKVKFKAIIKLF